MSISRVALIGPYYSHSCTSLYRNKRSLLKDLQMFYKCFVSIKEVARNHLISSIIKGVYYLAMAKPDVIDLGPPLVSWINSYKYLILRIWLTKATSQALVYFSLQDSVITIIYRVQQVDEPSKLIKKDQLGIRDSSSTAL